MLSTSPYTGEAFLLEEMKKREPKEVSAIEQTPLTNRKRIENFYVLYPFFFLGKHCICRHKYYI